MSNKTANHTLEQEIVSKISHDNEFHTNIILKGIKYSQFQKVLDIPLKISSHY